MKLNIILILSLVLLVSCQTIDYKGKDGYLPNNEVPMYGADSFEDHFEKRSEYVKKVDDEFKQVFFDDGIDSLNASRGLQMGAWSWLAYGDSSTAMKRFNQAGLFYHEDPSLYIGFAATLEAQGKFDEAKRYFDMGSEENLPSCTYSYWAVSLYKQERYEESEEKLNLETDTGCPINKTEESLDLVI